MGQFDITTRHPVRVRSLWASHRDPERGSCFVLMTLTWPCGVQGTGAMTRTTWTRARPLLARTACWPWSVRKLTSSASGEPTTGASPSTCATRPESPPTWTCAASPSPPWTSWPPSEFTGRHGRIQGCQTCADMCKCAHWAHLKIILKKREGKARKGVFFKFNM